MRLARRRASSLVRLLSPANCLNLPDPNLRRVDVELVQGPVRIVAGAVGVVRPDVEEAAGLEGQSLVVTVVDLVVGPVIVRDPRGDPPVGKEGGPSVLAHAAVDGDVVVGDAVRVARPVVALVVPAVVPGHREEAGGGVQGDPWIELAGRPEVVVDLD